MWASLLSFHGAQTALAFNMNLRTFLPFSQHSAPDRLQTESRWAHVNAATLSGHRDRSRGARNRRHHLTPLRLTLLVFALIRFFFLMCWLISFWLFLDIIFSKMGEEVSEVPKELLGKIIYNHVSTLCMRPWARPYWTNPIKHNPVCGGRDTVLMLHVILYW